MTGGTPTLLLLGHRTAPRSPTRCDCRATDPASPSPDDLRIGPQPNRARAQEPRADHTSGVLALASPCFPSRELITAHVSAWPNASFRGNAGVGRSRTETDINRQARPAASVANDPSRKWRVHCSRQGFRRALSKKNCGEQDGGVASPRKADVMRFPDSIQCCQARNSCTTMPAVPFSTPRYLRALAIRYSASASIGPPMSARSRRTSSRTARRISSGNAASAWPVEAPPRSKGP